MSLSPRKTSGRKRKSNPSIQTTHLLIVFIHNTNINIEYWSTAILRICSFTQSCPTLCGLMDWTVTHQGPLFMEFSRQEYWNGLPFPSPRGLPDPGIELRPPALQVDSLASEPPGKPKNTGVGSLSLVQGIFLTQESNRGLLHCRQTLYRLSHQGRPGLHTGD